MHCILVYQCHYLRSSQPRPCWNPSWNEPSSVPECLLSSLKTFEWLHYDGADEEKEAVSFIIRSAKCLKKATISITSKSAESGKELEMMIKDLFSSSRRSPDCQLECKVKLWVKSMVGFWIWNRLVNSVILFWRYCGIYEKQRRDF